MLSVVFGVYLFGGGGEGCLFVLLPRELDY